MVPNFVLKNKRSSHFSHESPPGPSPSQEPDDTSNAIPPPVVHHNRTLLALLEFFIPNKRIS